MISNRTWIDPPIVAGDPDLAWETLHENSKTSMFELPPSDQEVLARMASLDEALSYTGYPIVELPRELAPLDGALGHALLSRTTSRELHRHPLGLRDIATILHMAYGITRDERAAGYPRQFRTVPSGGAMYPLEIYCHVAPGSEVPAGLYHFNPVDHHLRHLRQSDMSETIADAMVQKEYAHTASLLIFVTAAFDRTIFKYGDRGYRFVFLEAGHVGQNVNLTAAALGLGSINLGGYYDRQIDAMLDLDGVTHSIVYMIAVGATAKATTPPTL